MVRSCVAGPVFRGDTVRWDDVGTIPFDALGAPGWNPRPSAAARPSAPSPTGTAGDASSSSPTGSSRTSSPSQNIANTGSANREGNVSTSRTGNHSSPANPGSGGTGAAAGPGAARRERHGS
jgi:hypothetical protein